jgi:hypothetical protein
VPSDGGDHAVDERLARRVEQQLERLRREFAGTIPPDEVTRAGEAQLARLRAGARIVEFIPLLVYRHTREALRAGRDELHRSA